LRSSGPTPKEERRSRTGEKPFRKSRGPNGETELSPAPYEDADCGPAESERPQKTFAQPTRIDRTFGGAITPLPHREGWGFFFLHLRGTPVEMGVPGHGTSRRGPGHAKCAATKLGSVARVSLKNPTVDVVVECPRRFFNLPARAVLPCPRANGARMGKPSRVFGRFDAEQVFSSWPPKRSRRRNDHQFGRSKEQPALLTVLFAGLRRYDFYFFFSFLGRGYSPSQTLTFLSTAGWRMFDRYT